MTRSPHAAVVGGGQLDDDLLDAGRAVGRGLAAEGVVVVCGGLGELMDAVCAGAAGVGGTSVAVLPGGDTSGAAPDASVVLPTNLGEGRNAAIARSADVVVAIGGGFGTLSEIALALRAGTPVVGYRTWGLGPPGAGAEDPILRVDSADDAVALATGIAGAAPS